MEPADAGRSRHGFSPLWPCIASAILPFVLQYIYIENAFYHFGAAYFDAGAFANLLWHNDWSLSEPKIEAHGTYLMVHFAPWLMLVNALSYITPLPMVEFYAVVIAAIYAALASAMCYLLMTCLRPKSRWQVTGIVALAVGYSFNGVVMQGVWMPHPEYAVPLFMLLFLTLYKTGHPRLALAAFAALLCLREDAGLHLTGVMVLLACARSLQARSISISKSEIVLIAIACSYSLCAVETTALLCRAANTVGTFEMIYSGDVPYRHLSAPLLLKRLADISWREIYLLLGFAVSLAWAIARRNLFWAAGFIAFLPWFILNLTAYNENTGILYAWYPFPFVLAMGWPFVAILWQWDGAPPEAMVKDALKMQVMLVIAGLIAWNGDEGRPAFGPTYLARWGSYVPQWMTTRPGGVVDTRPIVRNVAGDIGANANLGTVLADYAFLSLTAGSEAEGRGLGLHEVRSFDGPADTILIFCDPEPISLRTVNIIHRNNLQAFYRIRDTPICVATNRPKDAFGAISSRFLSRTLPKHPYY